jgi:hypothetical protein
MDVWRWEKVSTFAVLKVRTHVAGRSAISTILKVAPPRQPQPRYTRPISCSAGITQEVFYGIA